MISQYQNFSLKTEVTLQNQGGGEGGYVGDGIRVGSEIELRHSELLLKITINLKYKMEINHSEYSRDLSLEVSLH